MACSKCNQKGYVVISYFANNKENSTVKMCPSCEDLKGYSDYVKEKYSTPKKDLPPDSSPEGSNVLFLDDYRKRR